MPPSLFPPPGDQPARTPSPTPTHNYSAGIPAPPRILIPPPLPPMSHPYNNPLITPSSYSHSVPIQTPRDTRALQAFSTLLPTSDWKYECRRQAQMLLPNLFLGPLSTARDAEFLKRENIGLVVGIRAAGRKLPSAPVASTRFAYVDVQQGPGLLAAIDQAADLVDEETLRNLPQDPSETPRGNVRRILLGLAEGTLSANDVAGMSRTLLYCETGNERSAAVAAGYIMRIFDVDTVRAVQFVQSRRFCIAFTEDVKGSLVTFEGVVKAKRMVEDMNRKAGNGTHTNGFGGSSVPNGNGFMVGRGRKRNVHEEDEGGSEDGREGIAPFVDGRQAGKRGAPDDDEMMEMDM